MLSVRLLGGFSVSTDEGPVPIESTRLQAVLGHLILNRGEDQPRERLAHLFWPESGDSQARTNMRQALHRLRQALPDADAYLRVEKNAVAWRADAPARSDVAEFEELAGADDPGSLAAAVATYSGDLLPECRDDWIAPWRASLRETYLGVAERLAEMIERERDYRRALPLAREIFESDPLNEEALLRLMRLHALSGDRAEAMRVYHAYATSLARETGVEPGPEARSAYDRLVEPGDEEALPFESRDPDGGPLVGREGEWDALRDAWRRASRGETRLVAITGEAGIGKTRLADELRAWVARQGYPVAASRCYAAAGRLAYAPLVDFLRDDAFEGGVRRLGNPWLSELALLLPELSEERPDLPRPAPLTDDWHRARLLESISRAVLAVGSPILLVVDDLQWCDEETIGWLRYFMRSSPAASILIVATGRAEDLGAGNPAAALILEARAEGQAELLELAPLGPDETSALARSVAGRDLGGEDAELIFRETEGNPLFVVEWTRAGLADDPAHLPPRVQSVIETRFGQLSARAQDLASLAATVGRAFDLDVLARASSSSEEEVVEALDELRDRRMIRELPGAAFDFSHDKLREAAYLRAGEARRRMLHRRVADATESHATNLDAVAAELAAHYERAGLADRAAGFYARAAEAAHRVYSNERAIALFEKALGLLEDEPESDERDRRELALRTALGAPLVSIEGYGAQRVHEDYRRAWELCERLGTPPEPPVLRGLALVSIARGELVRARELGAQLLEAGVEDATVRVEGNYVLGVTSFWLGEFERSREHLVRAIDEYDPAQADTHLSMYSQDPRVVCLSRLALVLHYLDEPAEAARRAREAIEHAEELEHPFSLAYALNFTAWLAIEMDEKALARDRVERMASLADDQQLGFVRPMGSVLRGWLLAGQGDTSNAVALIREGIDAYARSGWSLYQPYALVLLARVCRDAGRSQEARDAIADALAVSARTGQHYLDAELHVLERELARA